MAKPSTPAVWASGKSFGFRPSAAQQAQGFDYIATVRPGTGAPITDDHDWPLNAITSALEWVMNQLPDGGLKYGCPLVGSLIEWPLQQMPHEIWPDCGMVFIPYIGQAFDGVRFPLLKQMHPSGTLPADMRGEFVRGFDNGRGVNASQALMTWADSKLKAHHHELPTARMITGVDAASSTWVVVQNDIASPKVVSKSTGDNESAPRCYAWNMIVRAA